MASTGFKAISQVAEILDRPEIDGTARHFILDLLTKTIGENIHLQDSLDEKNRDYAHLHMTLRELTPQAKMGAKTIRSLEDQVKEKDKEIGQKTMELRQHRWRSNKMIFELKDELEEKDKELEEIKRDHVHPAQDEDSEEDSEEEKEGDSEEEPRRRYVAPTVDDPLVPVMENGEKKWYRRSECCGSHSWSGEELWVRNWM
jgi:glycosylphosphatidylinositol transamidase (GPIT) subunit GPI8